MSRNVREWTCRLLEMVDDGVLDPKMALEMCTSYMSEDEVEDMMRINDLKQYFEDEDEEEYDGQPDEAQEWHDFDPDC